MSFESDTARLPSGALPYRVAGEGPPLLYFHAAGGARLARQSCNAAVVGDSASGNPPHAVVYSFGECAHPATSYGRWPGAATALIGPKRSPVPRRQDLRGPTLDLDVHEQARPKPLLALAP